MFQHLTCLTANGFSVNVRCTAEPAGRDRSTDARGFGPRCPCWAPRAACAAPRPEVYMERFPWQRAALLLLILGALVAIWAGGRIFRIAILMQGTPQKLGNLLRWAVRG